MKAVVCLTLLLGALVAPAMGTDSTSPAPPPSPVGITGSKHPITGNFTDYQLFQLALNLEYLEAEFYLFSAFGEGLDHFAPGLTGGGPSPIGGRRADLSPEVRDVAIMLAYQEIGHIRVIRDFLGPHVFNRPEIDIGQVWTTLGKNADLPAQYPFDPYTSDVAWLLAAYNIPYVGLTGYVGSSDFMSSRSGKHLLGGVLGVEGGQDAMLRTFLWKRRNETLAPYGLPIKQITNSFKNLANNLTHQFVMKNIVVPISQGAEHNTTTEILSANASSISYQRTPAEVLSVVYGTGHAEVPGGFFPKGANGDIAQSYL